MDLPYLRESKPSDIHDAATNMRHADVREVASTSGSSPLEALSRGYAHSNPCYTLVGDEGELLGMCGVAPTKDEGVGTIWMLGTHYLSQYTVPFIRHSRSVIEHLMDDYKLVFNLVDSRNSLHLRWLKWAGFTFIRKVENYGVGQIDAYEFIRLKKCVNP